MFLRCWKRSYIAMQERIKVATSLKTKGNTAYGTKRQYQKAVDYYTKAIEVAPKPEPTYHSNRAACTSIKASVLRSAADLDDRLHEYATSSVQRGCGGL